MALKDFFRALLWLGGPTGQGAQEAYEQALETRRQAEELQRRATANFSLLKDALDTPMIFANGVDNDLPGLEAALQNRAVWYDGKRYEPGQNMLIQGRVLALPCHGWVWVAEGADDAILLDPRGMARFGALHIDEAVRRWKAEGGHLHVTRLPADKGRDVGVGGSIFRFAAEVEP